MFFQGLSVVTGATESEALHRRQIVGTPEQIADELATWQEAGGDGVNLVNAGTPAVRRFAPAMSRSVSTATPA